MVDPRLHARFAAFATVYLLPVSRRTRPQHHKRPWAGVELTVWSPCDNLANPYLYFKSTLRLMGPTIRERRRQCAAGGHYYLW
jgi:hypothetical protein